MIIEDSPHDYFATQRGLRGVGLADGLLHCETGEQALEHLRRQDSPTALPELILLDLNLPGISGEELLQIIKADARLKAIPVVVLSTSEQPCDIQRCYAVGANAYLCKSLDAQAWQHFKNFWFNTVVLPQQEQAGAQTP